MYTKGYSNPLILIGTPTLPWRTEQTTDGKRKKKKMLRTANTLRREVPSFWQKGDLPKTADRDPQQAKKNKNK